MASLMRLLWEDAMLFSFSTLADLIAFMAENNFSMRLETMWAFITGEENYILLKDFNGAGVFKENDQWGIYIPIEYLYNDIAEKEIQEKPRKQRRLPTLRLLLDYPYGRRVG